MGRVGIGSFFSSGHRQQVGIGSVFVEWAIWVKRVSGLSFQVVIGNKWV